MFNCLLLIFIAENTFALAEEIAHTQTRVGAAIAASASRPPSRSHFTSYRNGICTTSSVSNPSSVASAASSSAATTSRKRPSQAVIELDLSPSSTITGSSNFGSNAGYSHFAPAATNAKKGRQLRMWEPASDPQAAAEMDVALADLAHSNLYGSTFGEDAKLCRVLAIARRLPPSYNPPGRNKMGGPLLNKLYDVNWEQETNTLLKDGHIFGISMYGDGATIKTTPMINALGSGVHNPFAMLDVFDCTGHCAIGGKKDATYIANLFLPLISKLENMVDPYVSLLPRMFSYPNQPHPYLILLFFLPQGKKYTGVVDMLYFDGASNVQKAADIIQRRHPRITSACAAEHTTSLFFDNVFNKMDEFKDLCNFAKKLRNVFGSTRHNTTSMMKKYSKKHNQGIAIGFIKPSDCR